MINFQTFNLKQPKKSEKNPLTENNISIETDLPNEINPPVTESEKRKVYWRKYRNIEHKSEKLKRIIQSLPSPVKLPVCRKVFQDTSCFEHVICKGLINYLRQLWDTKKYIQFYNILYQVCGEELIEDPDFLKWISSESNIQSHRFIDYVKQAKENSFQEKRGRSGFSNILKQEIFDMWVSNSINSTDGHSRSIVCLNKEVWPDIQGKETVIEETVNRRGREQVAANRY